MVASAPARAISFNNNDVADTVAAANVFDQANTYPNVVMVNGCTGTLINSRTILTAAHCFYNDDNKFAPAKPIDIRFGPDGTLKTRFDQKGSGLATGLRYTFYGTMDDIALVSLSKPVTARSITPVTLAGPNDPALSPGAPMVTVGYGQYGTGLDGRLYSTEESKGGAPNNFRRRVGETRFGAYVMWDFSHRDPGTIEVIAAQFRNPKAPSAPDYYGLSAKGYGVPAHQAGNGAGDSGGPLFLVRPDGTLIQYGVLALLEPPSNKTIRYGSISGWTAVQSYLDWIALNNPLREVSARQGNVLWSDASAWSEGEVPDNVAGSLAGPHGSTGRYYDVYLSEAGRVALDMNPTIDNLTLSGARAVFDLAAGRTLQVIAGAGIQAGQMALNGTLQTPFVDIRGGVLSGTGTVRIHDYGVQDLWFGVNNRGGIVAPGNADQLGVLTIKGEYEQAGQGTLAVRLGDGRSDRLAVTGTARLAGQVAISAFGAPLLDTPHRILTSAGLTGRFGAVQSDFAFLNTEVGYAVDAVTALLRRNATAFVDVALTRNQTSAAAALNALAPSDAIYRNILGLSAAEARSAFDLVSGEVHASLRSALIDDSRYVRDAANARLRTAPAAPPVGGVRNAFAAMPDAAARQPARETRLEVWGQAFGASGHIDGDGNAARLSRQSSGMLIGIDAPLDETWRIGALAGYNQGSFGVGARRSSATTDSFHAGLYGGGDFGAAFLRSGVFYSGHAVRTDRTIAFAGIVDQARADYRAGTWQAFGEIGGRWKAPLVTVEPYLNVAHVRLTTDAFTEQAQAAALRGGSQTAGVTFATAGLRGSTDFSIAAHRVSANLGAGWRRAIDAGTPLAVLALSGTDFAVTGVPIGRDAAVLDAGLTMYPTDNATVSLAYNGQLAGGASQHALTARLKIGF